MELNIALVTGEASADSQMATVVPQLRETLQRLGFTPHFWGIGGPLLRAVGLEAVARVEDLNVMGFVEVMASYTRVRGVYHTFLEEVSRRRPQLVILVDFPGFNMKLLPTLYGLGLTVVYHIPPKVWAHGWRRVHGLARYTHGVSCVLPFEEQMLRDVGVNASFVGNPLFSKAFDHRSLRETLPAPSGSRCIGILPGSRTSEVKALLPLMLDAFHTFALKEKNWVRGILPLAPTLDEGWVRALAIDCFQKMGREPQWLDDHLLITRAPLSAALGPCQYGWVCSGTATLEVCALGIPHSVVYKVHPLSYHLIKGIIRVSHVGLGNLCAFGGDVAPEFLQHGATVQALVADAMDVFHNPPEAIRRARAMASVADRFPPEPEKKAAQFFSKILQDYLMDPPKKFRKHRDWQDVAATLTPGIPRGDLVGDGAQ